MLRFLSHASITLCCLPLLGCSNDSAYTATAVLSLNQTNDLAPVVTPRSPVERAVQLERYAALITGYRVLSAVINDPDILELKCVQEAAETHDLIDWLEERITVEVSLATETLIFDVSSSTPQQAIALCDAVIEAFLEEVASKERNEFLQTLNTVRDLYQRKEEEIRIRREDLRELAQTIGTASEEDASPAQQLLLDQIDGYRQEIYRLDLERANKVADLLFLQREEKQTPETAEAVKKLKRELAQNKHKIEFFHQQYIGLAMQVDEIGEYSADLVRRQDELVHLTSAINQLGLLLARMELQARLNLRAVHIDSRPHVPGYDGDD